MPVVRVTWFENKDAKAKKLVAKDITESIVRNTGADADSISVIFEEVAQSSWARGGNLFEDDSNGL